MHSIWLNTGIRCEFHRLSPYEFKRTQPQLMHNLPALSFERMRINARLPPWCVGGCVRLVAPWATV